MAEDNTPEGRAFMDALFEWGNQPSVDRENTIRVLYALAAKLPDVPEVSGPLGLLVKLVEAAHAMRSAAGGPHCGCPDCVAKRRSVH